VQASIEKPKPGQKLFAIGMTKRDDTEICAALHRWAVTDPRLRCRSG